MEEKLPKRGIAGITDVQWRAQHAKGLARAKAGKGRKSSLISMLGT